VDKPDYSFDIPFGASLIARSMLSIFFLLTLIIGAAGFFSIAEMRERALSQLEDEARYVTRITTQALSLPLWNFDTQQVAQQLSALQGSRNFCGARVIDAQGKVFFDVGFPQKLGGTQFMERGDIVIDNPMDRDLRRDTIGTLEMCISKDAALFEIRRAVIGQLGFFAVMILAVMTAYYIALRIITQPLLKIRLSMAQLARTMEPITDRGLLKHNEIGALAHSFNQMVTDLSQTYNALNAARDRAVKADNAKSEFLANMSHELRTPLNNIMGIIQILDEKDLSAENREMLAMVRKSSHTLLHIVNDILDLSKIEAGEIELEAIPFDICEKMRHTVNTMQPAASRKGFSLICNLNEDELYVRGDPLRFERILSNLLSNAIRYTDQGSVRLAGTFRTGSDGQLWLRAEVIDTGIGIPPEAQARVFDKFIQADSSNTRRYGGTGLGLTITRELVELMKGRIGLHSEVGKGSTFWFEMPLESVALPDVIAEGERKTVPVPDFNGAVPVHEARILVAEDHEMNQAFMRKLFKNLGVGSFTIVENGRRALELVQVQNFDVVLMDCHMPEMNGYDATRHIRELPDSVSEIPIIAMTANAMAKDEERCLAIGMNAYISKPFDIADFKATLAPWISFDESSNVKARLFEDEDRPANMEILVASSQGDQDYIQSMIDLFVETAEKQIVALEEYCTDGINEGWVETAHALKGTSGVVGADMMMELCHEAQLMEDASAADRHRKWEAIGFEYARVKKFLIRKNLYKAA
jgi:signal transduction histidine kinase/DNA-binding NarL/FixJ family response regulator